MSKARHQAAQKIAQHLFAAENAADQAFGSAASLAAVLPLMRAEARVSPIVCTSAYASVARAIELQAQVKQALAEAHGHFAATAADFRIRVSPETGFGDTGDKPGIAEEEPAPIVRIAA